MVIRNPKDFWSGAMFIAVGLGVILIARNYPMGTAFKMGPAYFPTVLAGLLVLVGVATVARGLLRAGSDIEPFAWKPLALVVGSTFVFGMLIREAGLIAAVVAQTVISAWASVRFRWGVAFALAAGLAAFSVLLFVKALGLPLPVVGSWFGG
jgi:hypothetical protein